jgi:hypothetical protein
LLLSPGAWPDGQNFIAGVNWNSVVSYWDPIGFAQNVYPHGTYCAQGNLATRQVGYVIYGNSSVEKRKLQEVDSVLFLGASANRFVKLLSDVQGKFTADVPGLQDCRTFVQAWFTFARTLQ